MFSHKPSVYVNGVRHTIGKCYTFINGTRHQIFDTWSLKNEGLFLSNSSVELPFGTYQIVIRGAGGAGGNNGAEGRNGYNNGNITYGGPGGAGAKGELVVQNLTLADKKTATIVVGEAG